MGIKQTPLIRCPLCGGGPHPATLSTGRAGGERPAHHCPACGLVYISPRLLPDRESERARYTLHSNNPDDAGYRTFLSRILDLTEREGVLTAAPLSILDFGSGPAPVLAALLRERGLDASCWDPFFCPDPDILKRRYGLIFCTEVAEHFHDPAAAFSRLAGLLLPGGSLALITRLLDSPKRFFDWEYASDPTHVSFYSRQAMEWLAERYGWRVMTEARDLVLFRDGR